MRIRCGKFLRRIPTQCAVDGGALKEGQGHRRRRRFFHPASSSRGEALRWRGDGAWVVCASEMDFGMGCLRKRNGFYGILCRVKIKKGTMRMKTVRKMGTMRRALETLPLLVNFWYTTPSHVAFAQERAPGGCRRVPRMEGQS